MSLITVIKKFNQHYVKDEERLYGIFCLFGLILGAFFIGANQFIFHYTGDLYIPSIFLWLSPVIFALIIFSMYFEKHAPRLVYFTKVYGIYFFIALTIDWLTTGVQFTPFPTIDRFLAHWDQALGFNSIAVLNWTYAHPTILSLLENAYSSLGYQMFILPLIFAALMEKEVIRRYLLLGIISAFIGMVIYYFFPTAALTSVFQSPHFDLGQQATYLKFYEVHHRLPVSTYDGGLIAFPSMHVVWALMMTYLCKSRKWLFWPVLIVTFLIICSTVMLGWHYLIDIFGGILVFLISLELTKWIEYKKLGVLRD